MAKEHDSYLVRGPDGRLTDTRCKYGPGDRVRIIRGANGGISGTVDSLVGQVMVGGRSVTGPGYNVVLDDGQVATIKWDEVESD